MVSSFAQVVFLALGGASAAIEPDADTVGGICRRLTEASGVCHEVGARLRPVPVAFRFGAWEPPRVRDLMARAVRGRWVFDADGETWTLEDDPELDSDMRLALRRATEEALSEELDRLASEWESESDRPQIAERAWHELRERRDRVQKARTFTPEDQESIRGATSHLAGWALAQVGSRRLLDLPLSGRLSLSTTRSATTVPFPVPLEPEFLKVRRIKDALAGLLGDLTREGPHDGWLFADQILAEVRKPAAPRSARMVVVRGRVHLGVEFALFDAEGGSAGFTSFSVPLVMPAVLPTEHEEPGTRFLTLIRELDPTVIAPTTPQERVLTQIAGRDLAGARESMERGDRDGQSRGPWAGAFFPRLVDRVVDAGADFVAFIPDGLSARVFRRVTDEGFMLGDLGTADSVAWDDLWVEEVEGGFALRPIDVDGCRHEHLPDQFLDRLLRHGLTDGELDGGEWLDLAQVSQRMYEGRTFFALLSCLSQARVTGWNPPASPPVLAAIGTLRRLGGGRLPVQSTLGALDRETRARLEALLYGQVFALQGSPGGPALLKVADQVSPQGIGLTTPLTLIPTEQRVARMTVDGRTSRWFGPGELTRNTDDDSSGPRWELGERIVLRLVLQGFESPTPAWTLGLDEPRSVSDRVPFTDVVEWLGIPGA